jgi:hypothetical protein
LCLNLQGKQIVNSCCQTQQQYISNQLIYYGGHMFWSFLTIFRAAYRDVRYNQCTFMNYGIPYYYLHKNIHELFLFEVVYIVNICICNKSSWVWMDTIDYYIDCYIGIILVVKLVVKQIFTTTIMPL